mgnify:CR=1 FL=1
MHRSIFDDCRQFQGYCDSPRQYDEDNPLDVDQIVSWPKDEKEEFKEGFRALLWALTVLKCACHRLNEVHLLIYLSL